MRFDNGRDYSGRRVNLGLDGLNTAAALANFSDGPASGQAYAATLVLFFLAEIGDKTQIATVLLAARYNDLAWVVSGSVLGLMLANVPVAYLGEKIMAKVPAAAVRRAACLLFCLLGVLTLAGGGIGLS